MVSDADTTMISADLKRDAEARPDLSDMTIRLNFHTPTSISHWMQVAPREKYGQQARWHSTMKGRFQED